MEILEKFLNEKIKKYQSEWLDGNRLNFYRYILPILYNKNDNISIVETGTMSDNTQGCFTHIIGDFVTNVKSGNFMTIDIDQYNITKSMEFTGEYQENIDYVCAPADEFLGKLSKEFIKSVDLFYFDCGFDGLNMEPHEKNHLEQLLAIYDNLSDNAIIAVDDNYLPYTWFEWVDSDENSSIIETGDKIFGKSKQIDEFLLKNNWERITEIELYPKKNVFIYQRMKLYI